ncbi:MAG: replication initiator protein A [Lawsonibacter sp.]|nr:replication initiator protein A [Lawsonibacter sp.]
MNYIVKDSVLPSYLPFPKFLLAEDMKQTAQLVYALLLDRTTLSQANGWQDDQGHIFVIYPLEKIAKSLRKGLTSIKAALAELEEHGLIHRQRAGPGQPNRIYVLLPDSRETGHPAVGNPTIRGPTIRPSDGQNSGCLTVGNPATNNLIDNHLSHNNLSGATVSSRSYGQYQNVLLSADDVKQLEADFPDIWKEYVERLSSYMRSTGKRYQDHAATMRSWIQRDKSKEGMNHARGTDQHPDAAVGQGASARAEWNIKSVDLDV